MDTDMEKASCAVELPSGGAPEWVHLIPRGSFKGRDGRTWKMNDPERVLKHFAAQGIDLAIDYEHQSEHVAINGKPAPAAGWIKELNVRSDGIWGRVEWTSNARRMLAEKEYRFLSPVLLYTRGNNAVGGLASAGLTNYPNLFLKALARQETPSMNDFVPVENRLAIKLREILDLPESADDDAILERVQAAITPDPAKYVPIEQVKALMDELAALKSNMTTERAENMVQAAMVAGKLPPALEQWARSLCRVDPQALSDFLAQGSTLTSLRTSIVPGHPPARKFQMNDEARSVCRNLGIGEDDFFRD